MTPTIGQNPRNFVPLDNTPSDLATASNTTSTATASSPPLNTDDTKPYYDSYTGQPNRESIRFANSGFRNSRQSAEMRHEQLIEAQKDELDGNRHTKSRFPTKKLKSEKLIATNSRHLKHAAPSQSKIPVLQNVVDKPKEDMVFNKERSVYFNQKLPDSEKDPETGALLNEYSRNKIRTTKYTPLNFIPKIFTISFITWLIFTFCLLLFWARFQFSVS